MHLKGMLEIRKYANRSEATIISWIYTEGFPAKKLPGSAIWESDTDLIDAWRKRLLEALPVEEIKRPEMRQMVKRKGRR